MNLLSLGMPMEQQPSQAQSMHQSGISTSQSGSVNTRCDHQTHLRSQPGSKASIRGRATTPLFRRSIEEGRAQDGEEDKELSRRGQQARPRVYRTRRTTSTGAGVPAKVGRGRAQVQEGSWPELQPSEAQSPMQLVSGEENHPTASFSDLGEMKLDV